MERKNGRERDDTEKWRVGRGRELEKKRGRKKVKDSKKEKKN